MCDRADEEHVAAQPEACCDLARRRFLRPATHHCEADVRTGLRDPLGDVLRDPPTDHIIYYIKSID